MQVQRRVAQVEAELKAKAERAVKQDERSVQDRIAAEVVHSSPLPTRFMVL